MSRVLVIDDKEENLYYLRALLSGNGWEVEEARHGAEALILARRRPPDLAVSDLLMPVMDGYALLRHWRLDARLQSVPFVVYTATYTEPEDERLALDLGADAFILKPAEPEEFVARLRAVERSAAARGTSRGAVAERGEAALLEVYSSALIRKLEEKTLQLEEANRSLQRDLEERVRTTEKLREQATLLDKAQDAILVRDLAHRILFWNRGAERLYGWSAAEAAGRRIDELLYRDPAAFERANAAVLERGEWQGEIEQVARDGRRVIVEGRWTLLRDDDGAPRSILVINTDVTQRKRLEAQFFRAQRIESIGTLAAGIAHDLNNILAPILMSVETLRPKLPAAADQATIAMLETCCQRGADLVRQVLSFARGVAGERLEIDPAKVVSELVGVLRGTFPRSILLEFVAAPGLWRMLGDPVQLNQVLLNLCINGRDAMPEGGRLSVRLDNCELSPAEAEMLPDGRPGRFVRMVVADEGIGIPAASLDTIFEPFFTTKEHGKGTGLGLSTTLAIVRSHGGFVAVQSKVGEGSEFSVYLPAAELGNADSHATSGASALRKGNGEQLLIVDDEPAIREMTGKSLELAGYRVLLAADGVEALDLFRRHGAEISAVVTDMAMPRMDGAQLVAELRAIESRIRILGTSGLELDADAAGLTGLLLKPYSLETLLVAVQRLLADPLRPD